MHTYLIVGARQERDEGLDDAPHAVLAGVPRGHGEGGVELVQNGDLLVNPGAGLRNFSERHSHKNTPHNTKKEQSNIGRV